MKKKILLNKAKECFSKNPSLKEVRVIFPEGANKKTHWKVLREVGGYRVVEVLTETNNFLIREQEPADAGDKIGLETDVGEVSGFEPDYLPGKLEEEIVKESLVGKTIRAVDMTVGGNRSILELEFYESIVPARFEWEDDGTLIFYYKERPFFLRKGKDEPTQRDMNESFKVADIIEFPEDNFRIRVEPKIKRMYLSPIDSDEKDNIRTVINMVKQNYRILSIDDKGGKRVELALDHREDFYGVIAFISQNFN